jgi:hypothetical protein
MEKLTPNIFTNNMEATVAFYKILGFKITMQVPEEGDDLVWANMTNGSVNLMSSLLKAWAMSYRTSRAATADRYCCTLILKVFAVFLNRSKTRLLYSKV